jgi:predicted amidophosphoribosyltransferase
MSAECKGKCCKGYELPRIGHQGRFHQDGHVLCRTCSRFMKYDGIFCPCCANRVSRKSKTYKRVSKTSTVLNNVKGI